MTYIFTKYVRYAFEIINSVKLNFGIEHWNCYGGLITCIYQIQTKQLNMEVTMKKT